MSKKYYQAGKSNGLNGTGYILSLPPEVVYRLCPNGNVLEEDLEDFDIAEVMTDTMLESGNFAKNRLL
jgi:hypothetical protein